MMRWFRRRTQRPILQPWIDVTVTAERAEIVLRPLSGKHILIHGYSSDGLMFYATYKELNDLIAELVWANKKMEEKRGKRAQD